MENEDPHKSILEEIEIGVGTSAWGDRYMWNYGKSYTYADIEQVFNASLEAGINFFDTAEVYGQGRSEQLIGGLAQNAGKPVLIATKYFPYPWRLSPKVLQKVLQNSLTRLNMDQVFLYQIHWPFSVLPVESLMSALAESVRSGKTLLVGVSNYSKSQIQRALKALTRSGISLASNQVEYNLLNRQIEKNGLLARCQELGIRVIAYSPLAQGMLTGKYSPESPPPGMRGPRYAGLLKEIQPLLALMADIGKGHGDKTLSQVALNWLICKGTLPIPGAKTLAQVQNNNGSVGWRLTEEEVFALDKASEELGK